MDDPHGDERHAMLAALLAARPDLTGGSRAAEDVLVELGKVGWKLTRLDGPPVPAVPAGKELAAVVYLPQDVQLVAALLRLVGERPGAAVDSTAGGHQLLVYADIE